MKDTGRENEDFHNHIYELCKHIAGSAQITAISQLVNYSIESSNAKLTSEIVVVIRDFQPRLISYVKIVNGKSIVFFAVDQWVFERDVDRGFLGEALAGTLIFPHNVLYGEKYLHIQEIQLKKRLILELMENLVLSFQELSYSLRIKPEYFMYEALLNRVRIFPPLAYGLSNFMNGSAPKNEVELVFEGYKEALKELEKERKIIRSQDYVNIPKKFVGKSQKPIVRFINISKTAPRTLFTSLFSAFPQLLNFFAQNNEAWVKQRFNLQRDSNIARCFVDPQKYLLVPTAKGLVSLADRLNIKDFARKVLVNDENAKIEYEPVGGVLNDTYLIKAYQNGEEKKVLVKRFKDWSGFKWFPLSLWSFGSRTFAVIGRSRLARECAISEFLRREGFNVPKILHVNHKQRLVFMEYIEGEDLSNSIKRIAAATKRRKMEKDLEKITHTGEVFARVHSLNVTLGDTKPENVIVDTNDKIYLLDFEQASQGGDKSWDLAVFLYYSGHYLQPLSSKEKADSITRAFITGYLNGKGDVSTVKKAGASKYTRIFSVFTMPSIMLVMSNICKKVGVQR